MSSDQESITRLLQEWSNGNKTALDKLMLWCMSSCTSSPCDVCAPSARTILFERRPWFYPPP
jgi:hypothetical protein